MLGCDRRILRQDLDGEGWDILAWRIPCGQRSLAGRSLWGRADMTCLKGLGHGAGLQAVRRGRGGRWRGERKEERAPSPREPHAVSHLTNSAREGHGHPHLVGKDLEA